MKKEIHGIYVADEANESHIENDTLINFVILNGTDYHQEDIILETCTHRRSLHSASWWQPTKVTFVFVLFCM